MRSLDLQLPPHQQQGLTLIELLIAMTLSLGVGLAALALLGAAKLSYLSIYDQALLQDSGHFATEIISQALRQANFVPYDDANWDDAELAQLLPGVIGLDNSRLAMTTADISRAMNNHANHASDVLAVRFLGSSVSPLFNCAGFAVKPPATHAGRRTILENQRGWSIFYVDTDSTGTPELRCKYKTQAGGWNTTAIVRNVEAFRVLYEIGDADDAHLSSLLPAAALTAQHWSRVVAVQFALLLRGEHFTTDGHISSYRLFGHGHRAGEQGADQGTDHGVVTIADHQQRRKLRKIFRSTVQLRNPSK